MLSGVSPLMKVVTSRGPHLLKPRLCHGRYKVTAAASITSCDVEPRATIASHPETRTTGMDRQRCCLSSLIQFYATFLLYILLKLIYRPTPAHSFELSAILKRLRLMPGKDFIIKND